MWAHWMIIRVSMCRLMVCCTCQSADSDSIPNMDYKGKMQEIVWYLENYLNEFDSLSNVLHLSFFLSFHSKTLFKLMLIPFTLKFKKKGNKSLSF